MSLRRTRSLAGGASFIAGLIPWWKPFVAMIWAAVAAALRETLAKKANDKQRRGHAPMVLVRRYRHALLWLSAFLNGWGQEARCFPLRPLPCSTWQIIMDASPWGMGAILSKDNIPYEYFAESITTADLRRFSASVGEAKQTTLWEAFTLLICIRQWLVKSACLRVRLKSDSLGALRLAMKLPPSSPHLNRIAQEIALHLALDDAAIDLLEHVPGVTNVQADALSRLDAPEPKVIPMCRTSDRRLYPAPRDEHSWKAW